MEDVMKRRITAAMLSLMISACAEQEGAVVDDISQTLETNSIWRTELTYPGGSANQADTACATTKKLYVSAPQQAGSYPVVIFLAGTVAFHNGEENLRAADELAKRGFIAGVAEYPNWDANWNDANYVQNKASCLFAQWTNKSALYKLCTFNQTRNGAVINADCWGKGIASAGFSQGGALALMARNYDTRVKATVSFSMAGSHNGSTNVVWNRAGGRVLPNDRVRVTIGVNDGYIGLPSTVSPKFAGLDTVTGLSYAVPNNDVTTTYSQRSNGSGWFIVGKENLNASNTAGHCWNYYGGWPDACGLWKTMDDLAWGVGAWPSGKAGFSLDGAADWLQNMVYTAPFI
jgi:dienelactone hydrolase